MKLLSQNQIEEIKRCSQDIIENIGFKVTHKDILKIAKSEGAIVDDVNQIIKIPKTLLNELLSNMPISFDIRGLSGKSHRVGDGGQYCLAIVTDPWIIDYESGIPRRPCLEDIRKHTILAQKMDDVIAMSRMDFPVTDFDDPTSSYRALEEHLLNHDKHYFVYATSRQSLKQWLDIASIVNPGSSIKNSGLMTIAVAVVSPLVLNQLNGELLIEACRYNFPVIPTICPMSGTTSPYSKDGTLLLGNVENIFVAALTQMINPGNPFIYAFGPSMSNMRTGYDMYYTFEKVLWKVGTAQLAQSYNIPVALECGGSMTYRYDQQSGAEGMTFMLAAQSMGADLLAGIGSCYNANGMSAEMMIIQNEWLNISKYLSKGLHTNNLLEAMNSIKEAGPGGNFLADPLTLKNLRSNEFFKSKILDLSGEWDKGESMLKNAHQKVCEMTENYKSPVPEKIQDGIRDYFTKLYDKIG
ncbi:MAG: trimethylamine methyltransferase family protein [Clostridia bacterium]|nr:trimethylamine methyltransferase family protein [Clostridia bacterium]